MVGFGLHVFEEIRIIRMEKIDHAFLLGVSQVERLVGNLKHVRVIVFDPQDARKRTSTGDRYITGFFKKGFDSDGIVTHDSAAGGNGTDAGRSILIDENNKIVVVGYSEHSSNFSDMAIWRYNSDGTLDTTFGNEGIVTHNSAAGGNHNDYGNGGIIDNDGRVVTSSISPITAQG